MNQDRLKEIIAKIPWSALMAAYVLYLGYDMYSFYFDDTSPLLQKQAEIKRIGEEKTETEAKLKKAEDFVKSLDQLRAKLRSLALQLDELKVTVSAELDMASFLEMLNEIADGARLKINVGPAGVSKQEFYSEQAYDVKVRGVYVQVIQFLEKVSAVQRIVRVDELELKPFGPATARYVELEGKIRVKTYRYEGSKADEIVKKEKGGA